MEFSWRIYWENFYILSLSFLSTRFGTILVIYFFAISGVPVSM